MGCGPSKEDVLGDGNKTKNYEDPTTIGTKTQLKRQTEQTAEPSSSGLLLSSDTSTQEESYGDPQHPPLKLISEPSMGFPSSVAVGCEACHYTSDDEDIYIEGQDYDNKEELPPQRPEQPPQQQSKRPTVVRQPSDGHVHVPTNPPKRNTTEQQQLLLLQQPPRTIRKKKMNRPKKAGGLDNHNNNNNNTHHLRNIFAAPFSALQVASFQAPKFEKPDSERDFIQKALEKNFVFQNLTERQMNTILDAFERVKYKCCRTSNNNNNNNNTGKVEPIITQGDENGDYFYVIRRGLLHYEVDGIFVGNANAGQTFGELALIYTSPRAASVIPDSDCVLYRVDQSTFRYILQTHTEQTERDKRTLLEGIPFLKDIDKVDIEKLAAAMVPRKFMQGENIARKGEDSKAFFVIQEGKVRVKSLEIGGATYADHDLGPGSFFGESALLDSAPREAHFVGKTDGFALWIDHETFREVLGNYKRLIAKSADKKRLTGIRIIQNSYLSEATLSGLAASMVERRFPPNSCVIAEDVYTPAALYIVREGRVEVQEKKNSRKGTRIVEKGGYFGDDTLQADLDGIKSSAMIVASSTVSTLDVPTTFAVLTLEACRGLMDTTTIGLGERKDYTSIVDSNIQLDQLKRHTILGAGTFGQVWLASKIAPDGTNRPYALKIQSKFELTKNDQVKGVTNERTIMNQLNHPFLLKLVQTYRDEHLIYMLLGLVQGGELYTVIHTNKKGQKGLSEDASRFYSACIFEGLAYMHRRQIVYRDLKPENVLIGFQGYPVIVDFGFAKHIRTKTYTLCGTPLYIAPEVVLNRGHDYACDHWSWAVLTYEMVTGTTPFHRRGMDQITLFRAIANCEYKFPSDGKMSWILKDLIKRVLLINPSKRLGSLAGGVDDVFAHKWFKDTDFAALRRKEVEAPWLPEIKDPLDSSKFQRWDHLQDITTKEYPKLSSKGQKPFDEF